VNDSVSNAVPWQRAARLTLLAVGFVLLGAWRTAIAQSYPDYVPFSIWAAALFVFGAALYRHRRVARPDLATAARQSPGE
jgi:hypothetical protein